MMKLQFATKKDLKEAAMIARRQKLEEERKQRIFNPRWRVIGIDVAGVNQQIIEKESQKQRVKEAEQKYIREQENRIRALNTQAEALANERRKLQCEINGYRHQNQKKEHAREFDLNDPLYLRKSLPARIDDHDPRLTISSAQIFMGEDLLSSERQRQQKRQQRAWLEQQIQEREQAKADYEEANRNLQNALNARDQRIKEIDEAERKLRREIQMATAQFNLALAREQELKATQQKKEDEEDNLAEIYNNLTSDMLTENKECAMGNQFGPERKLVSLYRGMTDAEIQEIRNEQQKQREQKQHQTNEMRRREKEFDEMVQSFANNASVRANNVSEARNEEIKNLRSENICLSNEQRANNEYLDKVLYTNDPTDKYFSQFNTTSR